jgi:hypothetical protein
VRVRGRVGARVKVGVIVRVRVRVISSRMSSQYFQGPQPESGLGLMYRGTSPIRIDPQDHHRALFTGLM